MTKKKSKKTEGKKMIHSWICVLAFQFLGISGLFAQTEDINQKKIDITFNNTPMLEVIKELEKKSNYEFLYNHEELKKLSPVTKNFVQTTLGDILTFCLKSTNLEHRIVDGTIVIAPRIKKTGVTSLRIKGMITDKAGSNIIGATIMVKGTTLGVTSDPDGKFELQLPEMKNITLVISFVGMKTVELAYRNEEILKIILEEEDEKLDEVVITGFFTRKKESFTGSASTFTANELKKVGNTNLLQSLSTLDPAFNLVRNNDWGSDPNKIPDIEIRGTTSFEGLRDEYGVNPNLPLFILDGFETDIETVLRLDMNRIESLTVLKDAASTAIYGSRASNGVIVIETTRPKMGKLFVSYNLDFRVEMPDLSDYNLMNAKEKLEFEVLAKRYKAPDSERQMFLNEQYNKRLRNVKEGVNTYWLSEPLQTGTTNGHSVNISGGDKSVRYSIGVNYRGTNGVMKKSKRTDYGGDFFLSYTTKILKFSNKIYVNYSEGKNPTVPFSEFANANPYFKKRNDKGKIEKYLDDTQNQLGAIEQIPNPLWNYHLNSRDLFTDFNFRNNFSVEWTVIPSLKFRGRFSLYKAYEDSEEFLPAKHTKFDNLTSENQKGSYSATRDKESRYEADFSLTFGKSWERHLVNTYVSWSVNNSTRSTEGWGVIGFPSDQMDHPLFSKGFPENSKPSGSEETTRSVGLVTNFNYAYDNRYLMDFSYRLDGASNFGSKKRYADSWSVGIAWNLHNEKFIQNSDIINNFKIRGSVGTPSSQSFNSYQSYTLFNYDVATNSMFGLATTISQLGNENLKWQNTLDMNVGIDLTLLNQHLFLTADLSRQTTKNMIVPIDVPSSTGYSSYLTNLGKKQTDGFAFTLKGFLLKRKNMQLNINLTGSHYASKYKDITDRLEVLNEKNKSKNLTRYREGMSTTALWTVKSGGIDPTSGKEVFFKKDGTTSFLYDENDEIKVGDSNPSIRGIMGVSFRYKGLTASVNLRYSLGGDILNSTLMDKVENVDAQYNQDKRALYNRWQNSGDKAKFKAISLTTKTELSSRFVQKENFISGESINIGYEFLDNAFFERLGFSRVALNCYMNDIFRCSSIKTERGISYPFARNLSFSLNLSF